MKNSKEYSKKVNKLFRLLKRQYSRPEKVKYDEPVDALIYGIVSEKMTLKETKSAIRAFGDYFVDSNDLRTSSIEEIVENLGEDTARTRETAEVLTSVLRSIFIEYNTVSLKRLHEMGKRSAKKILEKLASISPFAINYCILTSIGAHTIPLTRRMIEYLREKELVHPEADNTDIEGFLTRQIASRDGYAFYTLLRRASEHSRPKAGTKTEKKTKTKARTGRKKKTKSKSSKK